MIVCKGPGTTRIFFILKPQTCQICWWHNGDRPDHLTTMRRPTERRWVHWLNGVRRTTSHSTSTRPRSWWWISEDRAEYTHPSPSTRHLWSGLTALSFLGIHITEDLTWSAHTDAVLKKAHQHLFFLRRLRKFGTSPNILRSFYTCTVESILTGCITTWFGNSTAGNLCKGSCKLPATLLEVSFPPSRTSTPGGV